MSLLTPGERRSLILTLAMVLPLAAGTGSPLLAQSSGLQGTPEAEGLGPASRRAELGLDGPPSHPVVVMPGLLGTKLVDPQTERVVWGRFFDLRALTVHGSVLQAESGRSDGLELPIDSRDLEGNRDRLIPAGILDSFSVIPHVAHVRGYKRLVTSLSACGYKPGPIGSCGEDSDLAIFYYDWRRDIVEAARLLAERIRGIRANARDPALKVDIIAHSLGGLIAEYFVLYGGEDVLDLDPVPPPTYAGASSVRRLILIAVAPSRCSSTARAGEWNWTFRAPTSGTTTGSDLSRSNPDARSCASAG